MLFNYNYIFHFFRRRVLALAVASKILVSIAIVQWESQYFYFHKVSSERVYIMAWKILRQWEEGSSVMPLLQIEADRPYN